MPILRKSLPVPFKKEGTTKTVEKKKKETQKRRFQAAKLLDFTKNCFPNCLTHRAFHDPLSNCTDFVHLHGLNDQPFQGARGSGSSKERKWPS